MVWLGEGCIIYEGENSQRHLEKFRLNWASRIDQDHEKRRSQEDQESEWEPRGHLAKMAESYREAEPLGWRGLG